MRAAILAAVGGAAACGGDEHGAAVADARGGDADLADAAPGSGWQPAPGTSWQWQLSGTIDTSLDVVMYDVDLAVTPAGICDRLRADGRRIVCYFSAGTYEEGRDDLGAVPASAIGNPLADWPDERWLD